MSIVVLSFNLVDLLLHWYASSIIDLAMKIPRWNLRKHALNMDPLAMVAFANQWYVGQNNARKCVFTLIEGVSNQRLQYLGMSKKIGMQNGVKFYFLYDHFYHGILCKPAIIEMKNAIKKLPSAWQYMFSTTRWNIVCSNTFCTLQREEKGCCCVAGLPAVLVSLWSATLWPAWQYSWQINLVSMVFEATNIVSTLPVWNWRLHRLRTGGWLSQ